MQITQIAILALTIAALAACQQQSASPVSAQSGSGATTSQATAAKSSPTISVDPSSMKSCDNIAATLYWDASKAGISTDSTEIWVGAHDADIKLFFAGGVAGETKTGPWAHPGTHFVLKNKMDEKILGEAVIGGPACQ